MKCGRCQMNFVDVFKALNEGESFHCRVCFLKLTKHNNHAEFVIDKKLTKSDKIMIGSIYAFAFTILLAVFYFRGLL